LTPFHPDHFNLKRITSPALAGAASEPAYGDWWCGWARNRSGRFSVHRSSAGTVARGALV